MNSQPAEACPAPVLGLFGARLEKAIPTVKIHTDTSAPPPKKKIASETCLFTAGQAARGQSDKSPALQPLSFRPNSYWNKCSLDTCFIICRRRSRLSLPASADCGAAGPLLQSPLWLSELYSPLFYPPWTNCFVLRGRLLSRLISSYRSINHRAFVHDTGRAQFRLFDACQSPF